MTALRLILSLTIASAVIGSSATAQGAPAPSRPSARPPASVPFDPRDAGFAIWRDAGAAAIVVAPFTRRGTLYEVVVQGAVGREDPRALETLAAGIRSCAQSVGLADSLAERLLRDRAWQAFDSLAVGQPLITFTVVPRREASSQCAGSASAAQALTTYGISVGRDTLATRLDEVARVELSIGDHDLQPMLIGRATVTNISRRSFVGADGLSLVRAYLDLAGTAPRGRAAPVIRLRIFNDVDTLPEIIEIPAELTERLWDELLPWRARRLAMSPSQIQDLPVALPAPRDARLLDSHRSYLSGAYVDATGRALARLAGRRVGRDDRIASLMQVGFTFAGAGDDASARITLRAALEKAPCLQMPLSTPASFRALLEDVRPVARCAAVPTMQVVRYGLVPGRVQRRLSADRPSAGLLPAFFTAGAAVASVSLHLRADARHRDYERETVDLAGAFNRAQRAHHTANVVGGLTYALWGGAILQGVLHERLLARRSEALRNYGASASVPIQVGASRQGVGLSIRFF